MPFDSIVAVVKFSSLNKKFLKIFQQEFEFPALSMYVNVNVPYKFLFHATKYCCRPYLFGSYKFSIYIGIQITLTFASLIQGVLDYWDLDYRNAPNTEIDKIFNL